MIDLKSLSLQEMTDLLKSMGQPAFRGKQVFTWLHRGARSFDEMSNLPKALRDRLAPDVPLLCMGHLFTTGGQTVDGDGVRGGGDQRVCGNDF